MWGLGPSVSSGTTTSLASIQVGRGEAELGTGK